MAPVPTVTPDGPAIRARRQRAGLTTIQLGHKTGRNPSTIRNLERGMTASVVLINQVANALGVDVSELIASDAA